MKNFDNTIKKLQQTILEAGTLDVSGDIEIEIQDLQKCIKKYKTENKPFHFIIYFSCSQWGHNPRVSIGSVSDAYDSKLQQYFKNRNEMYKKQLETNNVDNAIQAFENIINTTTAKSEAGSYVLSCIRDILSSPICCDYQDSLSSYSVFAALQTIPLLELHFILPSPLDAAKDITKTDEDDITNW